MSDTDSEASQQLNVQTFDEFQDSHVKQILQKGKKILPSYDEASLYALFKKYYSVDNIFLNEINIIARRAKGDFDDDVKKDWINVGRKVKTQVNKQKYNFLQDKQLIRRAEQYLKNKKLLPPRRRFPQDSLHRNNQGANYKNNYNRNNQNTNNKSYEQRKPKQKFVEKVQNNTQVKTEQKPQIVQQTAPQQNSSSKVENVPAAQQKSPVKQQKYKEKIQNQPQQSTKTNNSAVKKTQEKKPQVQQQKVSQNTSVTNASKKTQAPFKQQQKTKNPVQQPKKQQPSTKPVQQATKYVQKPVQASKPVDNTSQRRQSLLISSSHTIPTVQNFDPVLAQQNFEKQFNRNSFILKFIKPQAYPQRVSYVRVPDGSMKNVQIKVTGTRNQGSNKAL